MWNKYEFVDILKLAGLLIKDFLPSDFKIPAFEKTKYGFQILPDSADCAGPIYFAIICKQKSINS